MLTEAQKAQMKRNGTPDAARDTSAALAMKAELDALIAQMEADSKQHAAQTENFAAALSEVQS